MSDKQTSPNTNTNTNTDSEKVECQNPTGHLRDEFNGGDEDVWNYWHNHPHADHERWRAFDVHRDKCHDCVGMPYGGPTLRRTVRDKIIECKKYFLILIVAGFFFHKPVIGRTYN